MDPVRILIGVPNRYSVFRYLDPTELSIYQVQ
eukprot:SAG31_NODE_24543_length_479_cov_0.865789_1_plen_31_part_10